MKNAFKSSALVTVILLSALVSRAQLPGTPPPPPAPTQLKGPGVPPPAGKPALTQLTTLNGKVTAYVANDQYVYDRFTVQNADRTVTVRFPAHLGEALMKAAPKGSQVSLSGTYDQTPEGQVFNFYSLKNGSTLITDTPQPIQTPPVEQVTSFSGTISELNHDQRGMISGIVLDSKTRIALPPPAVEQLAPQLKTGTKISGTGIQRTPPAGVVFAQKTDRTDARTLSIGGQTFCSAKQAN